MSNQSLNLQPIQSVLTVTNTNYWLIEDLFEFKSLNMIFGAAGTCKSFIAMDLAYHIGLGINYYGKTTQQGTVVYIAGEGHSGIQKRFLALEHIHNVKADNIHVSSNSASITEIESVNTICDELKGLNTPISLIIVDTMHRNFGAGDENSAKDVGVFVKHLDLLKNATGAAILFIHHSGHGDKGHSRGSSAIRASLDTEYQVKRTDVGIELKCLKMKEAEEPKPMFFELNPISFKSSVGLIESAYLSILNMSRLAMKPTKKDIVLKALKDIIQTNGAGIPNDVLMKHPNLSAKSWVTTSVWRVHAYSELAKETNKQSAIQVAFNRAEKALRKEKAISVIDGHIVLL